MELSGHLIKGTGSFEVKEIAPISESGQLVLDNDFSSNTNWSEIDCLITGNKLVFDGSQPSVAYGRQSNVFVQYRSYRIIFKISDETILLFLKG